MKKSESENKIYWSFLVSMRGWIDGWINEEDERKKENLEEVRRNASHNKKKCLRFFTFTHFSILLPRIRISCLSPNEFFSHNFVCSQGTTELIIINHHQEVLEHFLPLVTFQGCVSFIFLFFLSLLMSISTPNICKCSTQNLSRECHLLSLSLSFTFVPTVGL